MRGVIAQVWTAPKCQAGAIALGALPEVVSDSWTESTGTTASGTLVIRRDLVASSGLALGRVVRLASPARGVVEWVVAQMDDAAGAGVADVVTVRCAPLRALLGLRGLVRSETAGATPVFTFTPAANQTPTQLLESYVLVPKYLAEDNLSWLSLGVIEPTDPFTLPTFSAWTRGQVVAALEKQTGARAVLRALPNDGGYALDLLYDPGASVPTTTLSLASSVARVQRTREALRAPTILTALTANDAVIGASAWRVTNLSGAVLTLRDPDHPTEVTLGPVQADGQLVGTFVRATDGTTSQITASDAAAGTVTVVSGSGFAVGDQVTIAQDAAGTTLTRLVSPPGVAERGVISGLVRVPTSRPERTLLDDPLFEDLSGRWATVGAVQVDAWPVTTVPAAGALNGSVSGGASSVAVDGFPGGYVVRRGQSLNVQSTVFTVTADAVTSSTGAVTVPVSPTVPVEIASGVPVSWSEVGGGPFGGGAGTTNGVQSVGASSLVLQGLPPTPPFASGHGLVVQGLPNEERSVLSLDNTASIVTATVPALDYDYPVGRACVLEELWVIQTGPFIGQVRSLTTAGTVQTAYTAGDPTIILDLPGRFIVTGGGSITFLQGALSVEGPGGQPLEATGAATFNASRQATVAITPATTWEIPSGQPVTWQRPGERQIILTTAGVTAPGSSSITVQAPRDVARVLQAGDTVTQSGARLYASATTTLTGGGGTIPISPNAPSALNDNAVIVAEAPATWRPDLPGGATAVRVFNSSSGAARLESLPFVIPGSGAISYPVVIRAHWLLWTPEPTRAFAFSTQLLRTSDAAGLIVRNETATLAVTDVVDRVATATGTVLGQTSVKLAFYATGADRPEFCFVKNAMVTLGSDTTVPFTAGSFSNLAFRTALRALADTAAGARYRIEGGALAAVLATIGDETAPVVIGQRVRLRIADLSVDVTVRVDQLTYSFTQPERWSADLGGIPPRIATIDVTVT